MIETGNIETKKNAERGWFIGNFEQLIGTPFHLKDFEVKWSKLKEGDSKKTLDMSNSRGTITVLIHGKMEIKFSKTSSILQKEGDYVFWDKGVSHSWEVLEDSFVITIRWPSKT